MKNKLFTDRKVLGIFLGIIVLSIFTLTIAYAALSVTLNIQGNARVNAADWDIYLANPIVKNGSVSSDVPVVDGTTLDFEATLNMPGDFYEFNVDVVNNGSIDAMISNVVKNPELTVEQAKFLKYEITYQNGDVITSSKSLNSKSFQTIIVRVEYRKDLNNSDLPTGQVVLDLSLTFECVQMEGSGGTSGGNASAGNGTTISADGDINEIGTIVTIGTEQFYTIGTEGDNVKLLSMYNLYVGGVYNNGWTSYGDEATGKQDSTMLGYVSGQSISNGTTPFSNDTQKGTNYSDYSGSIVEGYVNNYKNILETEYGVEVVEARLISYDELTSDDIRCSEFDESCIYSNYSWIYSTSYWLESAYDREDLWVVFSDGDFYEISYVFNSSFGVRPVIVVSQDYFN